MAHSQAPLFRLFSFLFFEGVWPGPWILLSERGRRVYLLHHQMGCLHSALGGESRAHILARLTPLVVESMQGGVSGGLSEIFTSLIK